MYCTWDTNPYTFLHGVLKIKTFIKCHVLGPYPEMLQLVGGFMQSSYVEQSYLQFLRKYRRWGLHILELFRFRYG